jgi:hypothetical protein
MPLASIRAEMMADNVSTGLSALRSTTSILLLTRTSFMRTLSASSPETLLTMNLAGNYRIQDGFLCALCWLSDSDSSFIVED